MNRDYLFKSENICKSFGNTQALKNVSITVKKGEIRGLIGENGSGKSTFSSICAGMQRADSGTMYLEGREFRPSGAIDAMEQGVSMVVQEQGTVGKISVAANVFFGKEAEFVKGKVLRVKRMNQEAKRMLESIGVTHIKPWVMIDSLTFEERKLVELARALYTPPKLWIVDETTTALTVSGREILYRLMEDTKSGGGSVLFISHDIDEIMRVCDSLTILRDGVMTAELEKGGFEEEKIKQLMIGREMSGHYYREDIEGKYSEKIVLETKNVTCGALKNVSVALHKGEILGIGGLSDCGMHELGKVMFGLMRPEQGQVLKDGKYRVINARWSVQNEIAYLSKNRDREALMSICSIRDNICLPSLKNLAKAGMISRRKERRLADTWSRRMEVKADSTNQFCNTLSGGNKQKVVLAKWMGKGSQIMLLDCPTRGIDIGTKAGIYHLIEHLKQEGKSLLLISEELPELIGMSDRIVMMKDGEVSGEFLRAEGLTEAKLIQKMI